MDEVETAPADATSSDNFLPSSLPPLKPRKGQYSPINKVRPMGVVLALRQILRQTTMETPDHSKPTLKHLSPKPKQDMTSEYHQASIIDPFEATYSYNIPTSSNVSTSSHDDQCHSSSSNSSNASPSRITIRPLPHNKHWHVFVSHSISDTPQVEKELISPLRGYPHNLMATCSLNFMINTALDNNAIKEAVRDSCVLILAISPAYFHSERCNREWRKGIDLTEHVIVIAFGRCNRPEQIKKFLYLNFIDHTKRETVWRMLMKDIDHSIDKQCKVAPPLPRLRDSISFDDGLTSAFHLEMENLLSSWKAQEMEDQEGVVSEEEEENVTDGTRDGDDAEHEEEELDREEGELSDSRSPDNQCGPLAQKQRKIDGNSSGEEVSQSQMVAGFYDSLAKPGADNWNKSLIFCMRNFNNWVKSVLIRQYLPRSATVLDLCCGKGGDLNKWKEGGITYVVCVDISEVSVEQCKDRYHSKKMYRCNRPVFEAEFIVADCCTVRLRDRYENSARRFHMTSCQFSLHYSFESYEKAMGMLQNACENLRPGGYFIGTIVDANEMVRRLRENGYQDETGAWCTGNDIYSVTLANGIDPRGQLPLFNCKYHFKLEGVVNVPEYLLHYPLLVSLLKEFDMKELVHQNFYNFFSEHRYIPEDVRLMYNMSAFNKRTGTMSASEWEAIGLYLVFVFQKTPSEVSQSQMVAGFYDKQCKVAPPLPRLRDSISFDDGLTSAFHLEMENLQSSLRAQEMEDQEGVVSEEEEEDVTDVGGEDVTDGTRDGDNAEHEEEELDREEGELSGSGSPDNQCGPPAQKQRKIDGNSSGKEVSQSQMVAGFYDSLAKPGADNRNEKSPGGNLILPTVPSDPSQFTVGTSVWVEAYERHPTGTIRWIGTLPDYYGLYAGVELDQQLEGCSDGIFEGRRYFSCPPSRGFFCLLDALQLDQRYLEPNQVPATKRQDYKNRQSDIESLITQKEKQEASIEREIQQLRDDKVSLCNSFDQIAEQYRKQKLLLEKEEKRIADLERSNILLRKNETELTRLKNVERDLLEYKTSHQRLQVVYHQEKENHVKTKREGERRVRELQETLEKQQKSMHKLQEDYQQEREEHQKTRRDKFNLQMENGLLTTQLHALNDKIKADTDVYHQLQQDYQQEREGHQKTRRDKVRLEEIARQSEQSWKVTHKDVHLTEQELGRGAWGAVKVGVFREQRVAVKELHMMIQGEHSLALLNREINTMSKLRHPNLLLFIGAVLDHPSGHPLIITEIMDTSLRQAYEKGQLTDKSTKLSVLRDTAAGLNYLHCHPDEIIHRDVSSANVLLESKGPNKWRAKLSDFGSANIARDAVTQAAGTAVYGAPESFVSVADDPEKKPQTTKMDVFSYGVLLYEVMTCTFPDTHKFRTMLTSVSGSSPPIGRLIQDCINRKPQDRPTMKQVIQQLDEQLKLKLY